MTFASVSVKIKAERTEKMKDKTFVALSSLFFLIFFIGIASVTLNKPLSNILKAKDVAPSPLKSFGVVFPQIGVAGDINNPNSSTKVKVSVYIRGIDGSILPNRAVKLAADMPSISIIPSDTQMTNNIGQAEFFITSNQTGKAKLTATDVSSNISVVNIPTVEFTR